MNRGYGRACAEAEKTACGCWAMVGLVLIGLVAGGALVILLHVFKVL